MYLIRFSFSISFQTNIYDRIQIPGTLRRPVGSSGRWSGIQHRVVGPVFYRFSTVLVKRVVIVNNAKNSELLLRNIDVLS